MIGMIACYSLLLFVFGQCGFAQEASGGGDTLLWDGLEDNGGWSINTNGKTSVTPDHKTEGNSSLAVSVEGQIPAQGVVLTKKNADLHISFANKVILDVYNSGSPCKLALAFNSGSFHESVPKDLSSGLNKNVTFEISPADFKSSFGYESVAKEVMLIIYPGDNSVGPVYFDNIRIKKYGGLKYVPPGISSMYVPVAQESAPIEAAVDNGGPYSIVSGLSAGDTNNTVSEHKTVFIFGLGLAGLYFYRKKI